MPSVSLSLPPLISILLMEGPDLQVSIAAKAEQLAGKLVWLDFVHELLAADGDHLLPHLQFDGTHLAPSYVAYLDEALQRL